MLKIIRGRKQKQSNRYTNKFCVAGKGGDCLALTGQQVSWVSTTGLCPHSHVGCAVPEKGNVGAPRDNADKAH